MEAFLSLGIALVLMAILVFGLVLILFLMLVGTVFALMMSSFPRQLQSSAPRAVRPLPLPRRARGRWEREEAAA